MARTPLAIYVHWPYCARICPYCDFNVYKQREDNDLVSAIIQDLSYWREQSGKRHVTSVHFGGGTPSLLGAQDIERILAAVDENWGLAAEVEIALEANPDDCDVIKWQAYKQAGISRLSLGVQTFSDGALKMLGRNHDSMAAKKALAAARDIFAQVSLDLIYGHKGQTLQDWTSDLDITLAAAPDHISAYQLTIEPTTAFGRAAERGDERAVDDDQSAAFYDITKARLTSEGYEHYEVSNYAKPGARSCHNLSYWQGHDYVGVGPGAHGRITQSGTRIATVAAMRPRDYTAQVASNGHGIAEKDILSPQDWAEEYLIMGLRILEGISISRYEALSGTPLNRDIIDELKGLGFVQMDQDRLFATPQGRLLLNTVSAKLLGV
ncbi:MAG: radical SAM family heme chaperone HemW [Maricaulaceae bacterium]